MQKMLYLCRVKHELLANTIIFIAMKRTTKLFSIAIACAMIVALNACRRANVNLNDIDTSATIETSLSLPLGTVSIKLGDIIGDSTIQGVSVDEHGQYIFSSENVSIPYSTKVLLSVRRRLLILLMRLSIRMRGILRRRRLRRTLIR